MTFIGINGFGRIGKCLFLQLIENQNLKIKAINAPDFNIRNIEIYLKNDSIHHYNKNFDIEIIDEKSFYLNKNKIYLLNDRNAKNLDWKKFEINYVIDATGIYLTTDKAKDHNTDYVILCAPPKDNTPLFVYNVNHEKYNGEKVISNASCTTNCITPVLNFLDQNYEIKNADFTTIHATTSSQNTIDTTKFKNRTSRSILNNIIPHSTGASSSIYKLLPNLDGKINGTSIRVPVSNVSLVDLNIELNKDISFDNLIENFEKDDFIKLNKDNLVSSDFLTTTYPSIIDKNASLDLKNNRFKLMIWYDNEWSYSAQVIRLLEYITNYNNLKKEEKNNYFIENYDFNDKNVVLRVDWNIPIKNNKIMDDFRIVSSLKTINKILKDSPKKLIIISHFGRPKNREDKYSWFNYLDTIQTYFTDKIYFLKNGLSFQTLNEIENTDFKIYLLENIRFHNEEINYHNYDENNEAINVIQNLGNFFVNDAFGCLHRDHLSICGIKNINKCYGYLINKEINLLKKITENKNKKILAIIGGAKMDDKLPLLQNLSKKIDSIYIAGGNINSLIKNDMQDFINKISENKAKIYKMYDGLVSDNLNNNAKYFNNINIDKELFFYDIGFQSLFELNKLINEHDIIFWNGTLGVVENDLYKCGSENLLKILEESNKEVIIGGGDTASFVNSNNTTLKNILTGGGASIDYISNNGLVGLQLFN